MKSRISKISTELKIAIAFWLCIIIIYLISCIVRYFNSYAYLVKTPHYKETMEYINNYDYSKFDKIYVYTLAVSEFENQSLTVTKEEEPKLFEDIINIFFNESREYGEHETEHNHTPTYYVTFTDEETSEELTIYVYSAYNVILYGDCYFKCTEDIHSDFLIIKNAIMNARETGNN